MPEWAWRFKSSRGHTRAVGGRHEVRYSCLSLCLRSIVTPQRPQFLPRSMTARILLSPAVAERTMASGSEAQFLPHERGQGFACTALQTGNAPVARLSLRIVDGPACSE